MITNFIEGQTQSPLYFSSSTWKGACLKMYKYRQMHDVQICICIFTNTENASDVQICTCISTNTQMHQMYKYEYVTNTKIENGSNTCSLPCLFFLAFPSLLPQLRIFRPIIGIFSWPYFPIIVPNTKEIFSLPYFQDYISANYF